MKHTLVTIIIPRKAANYVALLSSSVISLTTALAQLAPTANTEQNTGKTDVSSSVISVTTESAQSAPTVNTEQNTGKMEVVQLPSFNVIESRTDTGYQASNAVSATGFNVKIMDLPFSITAITGQYITDIGAIDLSDVGRTAVGVRSGAGAFNGGIDTFVIRGFMQNPQIDGIAAGVSTVNVDPCDIERVEVAMGPSSLLYGIVAPGGTINYLTKRAEDTPSTTVSFKAGSYNYLRSTLDVNQPLVPGVLLFRLNVSWENMFQWEKPGKQQTKVIVPTFTWKIAKNLTFRVNYQFYSRVESPQQLHDPYILIGTPQSMVNSLNSALGYPGLADAAAGKIPSTLAPYPVGNVDVTNGYNDGSSIYISGRPYFPSGFNYSSNDDYRDTNFRTLETEIGMAMGEHWNSRLNFNYAKSDVLQYQSGISTAFIAPANTLVYSSGVWSVAPSYAALTSAQQLQYTANWLTAFVNAPGSAFDQTQNGVAPPMLIPQRARLGCVWDDAYTIQAQAIGIYKTAVGTLRPFVSVCYISDINKTTFWNSNGSVAYPYGRTWDVDPASPTYYIDRSNDPSSPPSVSPAKVTTTNTLSQISTEAVYAVLNGSFLDDRLQVVAGARYNSSRLSSTNFLGTTAAAIYGRGLVAHFTNPQFGIGYKIKPDVMLYASFAESYTLPSSATTMGIGYSASGSAIPVLAGSTKPTIGQGIETGIKTNFLDGRIASTVSVYQITQSNILNAYSATVPGIGASTGSSTSLNLSFQGTVVRNDGLEFQLTYSPVNRFQIIFNASDMYSRSIAEPDGYAYYLGAPSVNVSRYLSNLWARYNISKHLWVGGGYMYQSRYLATVNSLTYWLPAYMEYDAAAGYNWKWRHTDCGLTLNVLNISNAQIFPAQAEVPWPRRAMVGLTVKF